MRLAVACLFGAAACRIAFDDEEFGFAFAVSGAVGQLAGQAQLLGVGRSLALDLAFLGLDLILLIFNLLVHYLATLILPRLVSLHVFL